MPRRSRIWCPGYGAPVRIRPAEPPDHPGLRAVCEASLPLEPDAADLPGVLLDGTGTRTRVALVAESAGAVVGVACGSLRHFPDAPVTGYLELLAVLPSARRQGLGRALFGAAEQALAHRGASRFRLSGNPPVYLWPGVDTRYAGMTALAGRMGYQRHSEALNLIVDLTAGRPGPDPLSTRADEDRLVADGIRVRRVGAAEAGPLTGWLRQGPWGRSGWPDEAARSLDRDPPGCHIAERAGAYLAFACHGANRRGWFGPMGTLDTERRRGIGAVLLRRCLADIRDSGLDSAQIGWTGPVQFYEHAVGAQPDRVFRLYRKDAPSDQPTTAWGSGVAGPP
jgi:mycothiol synthase